MKTKKNFFMRQKTCEMVPWNELSQVPSVLLPPTNNCICNEHLGLKAAILHKKINLVFFFLSRYKYSGSSLLLLAKEPLVYESHTHYSVWVTYVLKLVPTYNYICLYHNAIFFNSSLETARQADRQLLNIFIL